MAGQAFCRKACQPLILGRSPFFANRLARGTTSGTTSCAGPSCLPPHFVHDGGYSPNGRKPSGKARLSELWRFRETVDRRAERRL